MSKPSWMPSNGSRKEIISRAIPIFGAVVLGLGLVGMLVFSSRDTDVTVAEVISILVAVGGLVTIIIKQAKDGQGPGTTGAAGLLIFTAAALAGCGAPCLGEQIAVNALSAGYEAADDLVPADVEDRDVIFGSLAGALELGGAAVDSCRALRDGLGWQAWVDVALRAGNGIIDFLQSIGIEIPELLQNGLAFVEGLLSSSTNEVPADVQTP